VTESTAPTSLDAVLTALEAIRFNGSTEAELCAAVDKALFKLGRPVFAEKIIGPRSRIDRWIDRIGIEVKHGRTQSVVESQVCRYCESPMVDAVVLVVERSIPLADGYNGKPVRIVNVHHGRLAV